MSVVRLLQPRRWRSEALLIFADFQREYITPGRAYSIAETDICLANCGRLLDHARRLRLPIVHFRQLRSGTHFNKASIFSAFIDAFQPRPSEAIYERDQPSLYANVDFTAFLESIPHPTLIMAGLSADQACLATAVEAHRLRHNVLVLRDCSATPSLADLAERTAHTAVCEVISRYADVFNLDDFLGHLDGAVDRLDAPRTAEHP